MEAAEKFGEAMQVDVQARFVKTVEDGGDGVLEPVEGEAVTD